MVYNENKSCIRIYENKLLKPLEELDLKEGQEVETEFKGKRELGKKDILAYAGILGPDEEEKLFERQKGEPFPAG